MKRKNRNFLMATLAIAAIGATAAACENATAGEEKGSDYEFTYNEPLRAECDAFVNIDGKLDEDFWKDQNYLYWVGESGNIIKATTYFTSKGLYVGMYAEDDNVCWEGRYMFDKNTNFKVQVLKGDAVNYGGIASSSTHPTQKLVFEVDAKNELSRMEKRYDAAGYYEGELNGETTYMSAELFVPWGEMGLREDELDEGGMPEKVKLFIKYVSYSDNGGYADFAADGIYYGYYQFDRNGSVCSSDFNSDAETAGYSVEGLAPGDQWVVDHENKIATSSVERTQILWFRRDTDGNKKSTASDFVASVKVTAPDTLATAQYPRVGLISYKTRDAINIFGIDESSLLRGKISVGSARKTDSIQWFGDQRFASGVISKEYTGATFTDPLTGEEIECSEKEVYLTLAKSGTDLFYFVNGEYVGTDFDERLDCAVSIGLFANGVTTVSDWSFKDYSSKKSELKTYLSDYVYFLESSTDGYGDLSFDKTVAKHGDAMQITVIPNSGYLLTKFTINGEDKLGDFLEEATSELVWTYTPTGDTLVAAEFTKISQGTKDVFFEIVDAKDMSTKLLGATYVIRGDDKRFYYTGTVNNKGNIVMSLLGAGKYTVGGQEFETKGEYTIELSCNGYVTEIYTFSLPADFAEDELSEKFALKAQPFGSVTVNGTIISGNSTKYTFDKAEDNEYYTDLTFSGVNTAYLKNTVFEGNYVFNAEVSLEEDALTGTGGVGAVVGFGLTSGKRYISFKTAAWISGKLYLNYNGDCEVGLTGFDVTNEEGNSGFNKAGASQKYKIVRYNDTIYVYNVDGVLGFMLTKDGLELVNSTICEFASNLTNFNKGVVSLINDGEENAFGLGYIRTAEGGGYYKYVYSFTQEENAFDGLFQTATAQLKKGESYKLDVTGEYMIGTAFMKDMNVTLNFSEVPDNGSYYLAAVQCDDKVKYYAGTYDKTEKTFTATAPLSGDSTVWLVEHALGQVSLNGHKTPAPTGNIMTEQEDGSFVNDFDGTTTFKQYYADRTVSGDYYVETTISVKEISGSGSGYGLMVSTGEHSLCFFTNAWEIGKLLVNIGGTQGGTQVIITGFPRGDMYKAGGKLNFKLIKVGDVLSVYNCNGELMFTIDKDNGIVFKSDSATYASGTQIAKMLIQREYAAMVAEGKETAFGIYREFNAKAAYAWKADVVTDADTITNTKYDWDNQMYAASSVVLNGVTVSGTENAVKYQPRTATYLYVESVNKQIGFVASTETKKAIVTSGDYTVRVKMSSDKESDFRIYSGKDRYFAIRTGVSKIDSGNRNRVYSLFFVVNGAYASETYVGGEKDTSIFANPCNTADGNTNSAGELDLTIVRYNNKIYVYAYSYLDSNGNMAKHANWKLIFSFDGTSGVAGSGLTLRNCNGDTESKVWDKFVTQAESFFGAGAENAFAMTTANTQTASWKVSVTEGTDKAKAFVENPPAVD